MGEPSASADVFRLSEAALDVPPAERRGWLERQAASSVVEEVLRLCRSAEALPDSPELELGFRVEAPAPDRSAESIGGYRLLRRLGEGGTGEVYLATGGASRQQVAIKLVREGRWNDRAEAQFERERRILARLDHPNIARFLGGGRTEEDQPYLITEYVPGRPIDEYAADQPLEMRLRLFVSVCAAVICAHRVRIIHRDIKPSNILVTAQGQPKLLDFGIGKELDAGTVDTRTLGLLHTPPFASPEQLRGESLGPATDVYSLGVVLYVVIAGELPFNPRGTGPAAFARQVSEATPRPPSDIVRTPAALDAIVARALGKRPCDRFPDVDSFAETLRRYILGG